MPPRYSHTTTRHILAIDELLLPDIASAQLFMTRNPAAFLALPHAFPGKWEQARQRLDHSTHSQHPHMHTLPYDDKRGISLSSWHHGERYQTVISGRPESIAYYTEQTENERERYLLQCVKQNASGNELLAVAELKADNPIDSIAALAPHHDFRLIGTISVHRTADSAKLTQLRGQIANGTHMTLLTREHLAFIQSFAARHGLFPSSATYVDAAELPETLTEIQVTEIRNALGIGHCTATGLLNYITDANTTLTPGAQSLLY